MNKRKIKKFLRTNDKLIAFSLAVMFMLAIAIIEYVRWNIGDIMLNDCFNYLLIRV